MADSTATPFLIPPRFWLLLVLITWALLLAQVLALAAPGWAAGLHLPAPTPAGRLWNEVGFLTTAFIYHRTQSIGLRNNDFVAPLRRLFLGPGLLAFGCVGLYVAQQAVAPLLSPPAGRLLLNGLHTLNLAFFIHFLAATLYAWRGLLLFRATRQLQIEWQTFEVLLGVALLMGLANVTPPLRVWAPATGLLGLFGAYLSLNNQRWVTYLLRAQKLQALFLQVAILLSFVTFGLYFRELARRPDVIELAPQQFFLVLAVGFSVFYIVAALLVTAFNLPTAAAYEQRREELLNFQAQCQLIQRGTSAEEVFDQLLLATVRATEADAAWLRVPGDGAVRQFQLDDTQLLALETVLQQHVPAGRDYVNNALDHTPDFRVLNLPYLSLLLIPLEGAAPESAKASGEALTPGVLVVVREASQAFDRSITGLVQIFANQAQLTLQNLSLTGAAVVSANYKRELRLAAEMQQSLIPTTLPADRGLNISVFSQAATEVGGDFYDFRQLSPTRLAIIVGDVSGKGISAAFHVAQMKGIFHSLMQLEHVPEPDRFMAKANAALAFCLERNSFITASLYVIDYEQRGFAFARAGHCHTLYYNAMTEQTFYFQTPGLGLGIVRDESYGRRLSNLYYDYNPGDVMVIYTDGITEARAPDGQEYGEERLRAQLASHFYLNTAQEIRDAILADFQLFAADAPIHDDQTLLVLRFREESA